MKETIMMRKILITALSFLILICALIHVWRKSERQEREIARLTSNVNTLTSDAKYFAYRDSLKGVERTALLLRTKELETLRAKDAELIKELRIKAKDVRAIVETAVVYRDSVQMVEVTPDSCFTYRDAWTSIELCPRERTAVYSVSDTVTAITHVKYLRRFLWWRWKPRHTVTVVSSNPNVEFVTVESVVAE